MEVPFLLIVPLLPLSHAHVRFLADRQTRAMFITLQLFYYSLVRRLDRLTVVHYCIRRFFFLSRSTNQIVFLLMLDIDKNTYLVYGTKHCVLFGSWRYVINA